jgi:hypothetical protein
LPASAAGRRGIERLQRVEGLLHRLLGVGARRVYAEQRGVGRFAVGAVGACGLAHLLGGRSVVQDVVGDLERQPQRAAVGVQRVLRRLVRAHQQRAREHARPYQCARLVRVDKAQLLRRHCLPLAQDVFYLPAAHALHARRRRNQADDLRDALGRAEARLLRQQLERFGEQRVACENRHRLAVLDPHRRLPAAQAVIVHRGQVVMHEAEGVNQFQRAGGGHHLLRRAAKRLRRRDAQDGAQPLARGQRSVAHRVGQDAWARG